MAYTNSPMVAFTKLSPNHSGQRTHSIDRITPHCVVGQCTAEGLGEWFEKASTKASSNYGIDKDGRVGMYVEEKNRSWCSSSAANDQRAVTIECASDTAEPYAFRDVVYQTLIRLCTDICQRNGKKKLLWIADKDRALAYTPAADEMVLTVHRWFANKSCPGNWMYARMGDLAAKVTAALGGTAAAAPAAQNTDFPETPFMVAVIVDNLNIRTEGSMNGEVVGQTGKGTFTIIDVKNGWGKLKSGAGWIYLGNPSYCTIGNHVAAQPVQEQATTQGTGCDASKVIAVAVAEIGYKEKKSNSQLDDKTANAGSGNYTKYASDFDQKYPKWYNGKKNGYAWCDMFVDWCFLTAYGYENALRLLCQPEKSAGAGCTYSLRYYKNKGQFHTSGPKPGDQIFFGTSLDNSTHTGIVEKVTAQKVYTIEGNTSDQVARRNYALSNSRILGYGRPAYDAVQTVAPTPTAPAVSATNGEKSIWDALMAFTGNAYGAAGLMGNLYAESALNPKNLQNNGNKALGMTDEQFTAAMDAGTYGNFVNDGYGYGLAQWTYHSRKAALLAYAQERGVSIGDLAMQLAFMCKELEGYSSVLKTLKSAKSVREASDVVLKQYERPADQGTAVQEKRAAYGQKYFDKYAGNASAPAEPIVSVPFLVKVTIPDLNIRTGPGTEYERNGYTGKGVFTIVEVFGNWGRLKSGAGWISLNYATKL